MPRASRTSFWWFGVNGSGKTTTIAKLANSTSGEGRKVMLAAGDTFPCCCRGAAQGVGDRAGVPVVSKGPGADAAGLAYEALERARAENCDVLLIDTAGRLHNKTNLMDELAKVVRVIRKLDPASPHSCLLVLDATTGQERACPGRNLQEHVAGGRAGADQARWQCQGAGVLVALAEKFGLPVVAIGVGEGIDDLRPFEARAFARGLMGLDGMTEQAGEENGNAPALPPARWNSGRWCCSSSPPWAVGHLLGHRHFHRRHGDRLTVCHRWPGEALADHAAGRRLFRSGVRRADDLAAGRNLHQVEADHRELLFGIILGVASPFHRPLLLLFGAAFRLTQQGCRRSRWHGRSSSSVGGRQRSDVAYSTDT